MDRSQHYYHHRGFEAPAPIPHFMDTLDLNLHLAPPPSMESTPPYPIPIRSSAATNMFNFRTPTSVPTPQPVWTRFFLDLDNPSPSPPSPGEVEYGYHHHHHDFSQSPFWGMDFSDIDSGQPLDLDLSPLLHEHLFRDDEETGFHFHHHHQHQHQHQQPHAHQEDEHVGWWRSRSSTTTTTAASEAPQADAAAEMKSQNSSLEFAKKKNPAEAPVADSSQDEQAVKNSDQTGKEFFFDCNVCFDIATEPVVTSCGHLFCWPCLYQWLHVHSHNDECPVCKGAVSDADVIPIYGRGAASKAAGEPSDAAGSVPPRPRGRRVEQQQVQHGAGADVVLSEMLRWRRAMRFMHDNVERMFQGGGPGQPSRRPSRRRLMRTEGLFGALPVTPRMTGGVESVIEQLHQHWPAGFSPEGPVFNPPEPPAYNVVHGGMRRIV